MKRELRFSGRFLKDMKSLDPDTQRRIIRALDRFVESGEGDVRPLRGEFQGSYRIRLGKWRIFVRVERGAVIAYKIDNRGEAY